MAQNHLKLEPLRRGGLALLVAAAGACGPGGDANPDEQEQVAGSLDREPSLELLAPGVPALLQAVSPVSDSVVWISGHEGIWIRSEDGGITWVAGTVEGHEALQFRDVHAFDARSAVLMSAGPGSASRIFRTEDGGRSWTETFVMREPEGFLDCMDFWDDQRGLVFGDAVEGATYLLFTEDGGRTWSRIPPNRLPPALEGEGGFAASGTCLRTGSRQRAWISTGNAATPRLLSTEDAGETWTVRDLPLSGGTARGPTSVGFRPDGLGFVLGGNIGGEDQGRRIALSADAGITWSTVGDLALPGPVYGAAWVPSTDPATLFAVGPGGMDWSRDGGMSWQSLDTLSYWAVEFGSSRVGWAAGPGGRVVRIRLRP